MKRIFLLGMLLVSCKVMADDNTIYSQGFSPDTRTITLSTTPASPTQIMTKDSYIRANWVIGVSSFSVYISSFNTTISTSATTGRFKIPGVGAITTVSPWMWTPDGSNSVYQGQMWAISEPQQTPAVISVFRTK